VRLICGYVRLDGQPADSPTLDGMCQALESRGPKPAVTQRVEGAAAFAVLDFSQRAVAGQLPTSMGGTWLAADVRLDDIHPHGESSAALDALESRGPDLPAHLNGDYALAFWTPRNGELMLARDIMGVRPLCYIHIPGKILAFASVPRGIHASKAANTRLDLTALGMAQVRMAMPADRTGWEGVTWLLPGHTLTSSANNVRLHQSWKPDPAGIGVWKGSAEEAAAELLSHVDRAVSVRLRGSGAVASHLSGGLDSSGIVVLAARKLREQGRTIHAFSILTHPDVPVFSEAPWVEAVLAAEPDIDWTPEYLATERFPPGEAGDPDLPLEGSSATPDRRIVAGVAARGVSLMMSGVGGDEGATYNGPNPYAELLRQKKILHAFREVCARARVDGTPLLRQVYGRLVAPMLPDGVLGTMRRAGTKPVRRDLKFRTSSFLSPAFRESVLSQHGHTPGAGNTPAERIGKLMKGLDDRANRWSIMCSRHGVAMTFPLADRRVLDFCLTLPLERVLADGYARQPYRNAMRGVLPEKVRLRTSKVGSAGMTLAMLGRYFEAGIPVVESLRGQNAVKNLFDFNAMRDAFRHAGQSGSAPGTPADYSGNPPPWLFRALHADRALTLAEHIVRFTR
jgi:asparagine synthase (glutamine-hydrolysing)